ncbi:hypothetical protein [Dyadobacter psychrotolerans]|uniref:Uncharacterized protein n=1 Tax=Dyadobacter psychrotolerans TaxID=2541721 RepID=A0A4R5DV53_9BACT|nr:hypothetical protein [Dyadobacter psychrotolerans]TDE17697.1 hypothetical protein E0F88_07350 [Dyadobacter psychrotolerans]
MKETLESIRNFHNILILICAAGFLFSLSVKPKENPYSLTKSFLHDFATDVPSVRGMSIVDSINQPISSGENILERFSNAEISSIYNLVSEWERIEDSSSNQKDSLMNSAIFLFVFGGEPADPHYNIVNRDSLSMLIDNYKNGFSLVADDSDFSTSWNFVKNMTLNDAVNELESQVKAYDQLPDSDANLFGYSVSAKHMPIIAPAIELLILLYILTLIRHATSLTTIADKETLKSFPWVGLFPGVMATFLTILTLFLFPLIAAMEVIFSTDLQPIEKGAITLGYFVVLSFVCNSIRIKVEVLQVFKNS